MVFHVSLQSQKIVNLYPGTAADAPAVENHEKNFGHCLITQMQRSGARLCRIKTGGAPKKLPVSIKDLRVGIELQKAR